MAIGLGRKARVLTRPKFKKRVFVLNFNGDVHASQAKALAFEVTSIICNAKEGDEVEAVNSKGEATCKGKVLKVRNPKSYDHTPDVTIAGPKKYIHEVRGIKCLRKVQ